MDLGLDGLYYPECYKVRQIGQSHVLLMRRYSMRHGIEGVDLLCLLRQYHLSAVS